MTRARDLLLEIGVEELPAAFVEPALKDLKGSLKNLLDEARLSYREMEEYGTPRRLAVIVRSLGAGQPDRTREVTGPPSRAAYDKEGNPTRAALGFAKGQNVSVDSLYIVETPKGPYVAAKIDEPGSASIDILPKILFETVSGIPFKKSMRWGDVGISFARPIHWITALFGTDTVSFEYGNVKSGNRTRGHRFLSPKPFILRSPFSYLNRLEKKHVLADPAVRRERIIELAEKAISEINNDWRMREDPALLEEVSQLVEWPVPVVGGFDPGFLDLPPEVLVSEMRQHQRYFSIVDTKTGELAPAFVAVSNTPVRSTEIVRGGYERVLTARLTDARYFYDNDRSLKLESRVEDLGRVVFHEKLGTVLEKVRRVEKLGILLSGILGMKSLQEDLSRTIALSKADLTTGMVGEFPDLQGIMGRYYAHGDGEKKEVAEGIREHYLPRFAGDCLPSSHVGAISAIADRIDTLAGIFAINKAPTGTADPFGLRRACLGIVNIILDRGYRLPLYRAVDEAIKGYRGTLNIDPQSVREKILDFFRKRIKNQWTSQGFSIDVVEAVLAVGFDDLVSAYERMAALTEFKKNEEFLSLAVAFSRASHLVAKAPSIDRTEVNQSLFESPVETGLWKTMMKVRVRTEKALKKHDYSAAMKEMIMLRAPVDDFFDGVLVMAEDAVIRDNRLLLLRGIVDLFADIADFSLIRSDKYES